MSRLNRLPIAVFVFVGAWMAAPANGQTAGPATGASPDQPAATSIAHAGVLAALVEVPRIEVPPVDLAAVSLEDEERDLAGLPPRFAIPNAVSVTPETDGLWEAIERDLLVWRLRIGSPGALSLNLGFARYRMPAGGRLFLYAADLRQVVRPFTAEDNQDHGQLWTPVVLADEIVVELTIPASAVSSLELELTSINVGYRGFGERGDLRSGACNVDVICPEGDNWRAEIPSVGVISTGGSLFCTGFMVNNTAQNQTPFFMTANHCGVTSGNAPSLVVYWNFQSPTCGQHGGGSLSQFQTGSTWRSSYSASDFTLVQLNSAPNPAWNITFAGWDRSSANPTSAVAIHHPSTDEKSISFEYDPTSTTSYLGTSSPGDGTHIRITDWDLGTTEPGSSGSPLFDQNHHVVGQLHGGYASCTSQTSDWYGRFSVSWTGGGSNSSRLSNWLDPGNTGGTSVDTLAPGFTGLRVTPPDGLSASGPVGGAFAPASIVYTLQNQGTTPLDYSVTGSVAWLSVSDGAGTLAGHASTTVTVSINANANALAWGLYADTVNFINTTDHDGDTARNVSLQVGGPAWDPVAYNLNASTAVNVAVNITLSASDPNGDPLTYAIESLSASGSLTDPGGGAITTVPYTLVGGGKVVAYQPPCGVALNDGFTFSVHDATAGSNVATVSVTVNASVSRRVYWFPMDSNPGWSVQGAWAFGVPIGGGSHNRDPVAGYTGAKVYGYNLAGDYTNNMTVRYLTTTALNCANMSDTELRFRRWLGVERYDRADLAVSNDGINWTPVWTNPSEANVNEAAWSQQTYDISAVADGSATVYIRWGMGPTDYGVTFAGWNLDDVELWGVVPVVPSDFNGDGFVNLNDFAIFNGCLSGPDGGTGAGCLCVDLDADGDVDLTDFAELQAAMNQ